MGIPRNLAGYAVAALVVAVAAAARLSLAGLFSGDAPLLLFYAAVSAAALYGGLGPGLVATTLAAATGASLFMERDGWQVRTAPDQLRLAIFLASGLFMSLFAEVLHAARRRVATLLENMPDACSGFDRAWRYTYVNSHWVELFGVPASKAVGRVIWEAFPQVVGTAVERNYRRVMAERVPVAFETYAPYADRWVEVRAYPTEDGIAAHVRDITERKRIGQELLASERRYRALVRATPQAVWSTVGPAKGDEGVSWWREMTGQSAEQADGWGWLDALHPDDRDRARAAWSRAMEQRTAYEVEYRVRSRSGTYRWVTSRGVPVFGDGGGFVEWVGTLADVQDREDAAAALRLAEERLRLAIEASGMATWDWDLRTDKIVWSDSHYRLFGCEPTPGGEVTFQLWRDRVHPDDLPLILGHLDAARRHRSPYSVEYRVSRPGGELLWVAATGRFLYDTAGRPTRMVGVAFDVTQRRRFTEQLAAFNATLEKRVAERTAELAWSEAALRESEARYRTLFEHTPVAVWEEDFTAVAQWFAELRVAGVTDLRCHLADQPEEAHAALQRVRVLDVNHEAAAQNGATDKRQLMANLPALFTERSFQAFVEELALLYEGQRSFELSTTARRLDGRLAELVMRIQVPGPADTPDWGRVIVTGTDVTERARAEDELRRARTAAEAASRAKSEFLANMSHEIRTPMNGVLGMTELLLDTELTAGQRQYLMTAKQSAESLLAIIDDILDFSKIEAGRLPLDHVEFRPRDGLGDVLRSLAPAAAHKGLTLESEVAADVPEVVVGDPVRLRQVLVNLVGNAVKFTSRGGVTVRVFVDRETGRQGDKGTDSPIVFLSSCLPASLSFEVQDTGIGIPADKRAAIFRPFEQAETSISRRFGGTGLGLTISARLVELMGGRIWVESEEGQGSTFHFTVPLGVPVAPVAAPVEAPAAWEDRVATRPLRILLAEDNPINQRVALGMLEMLGHQAVVAENGREAVERFQREPFDLVLMDVQMPQMDGLEATARIREIESRTGRRIPIVALTAHAMKGDRERFLASGMDGYVTKPVRLNELRQALGRASAPTPAPARDPSGVIDGEALLGRAGGRADVAARVLAMLPGEAGRLMIELPRRRGRGTASARGSDTR
ncbi:MAG: PAS domain S-box protein [Gemmataceae bacterium]